MACGRSHYSEQKGAGDVTGSIERTTLETGIFLSYRKASKVFYSWGVGMSGVFDFNVDAHVEKQRRE